MKKDNMLNFEPAFLGKEKIQALRNEIQVNHVYGVVPPNFSPITYPMFDMDRVWKLLDGAVDFHVHSGPDAYTPTLNDELDLAIEACKVGLSLVFKCHSMHSARSVYIVQKVLNQWAEQNNKKKTDVFGGVVLNYCVGGLNPEAVITSYRVGGKVVWLPNLDASFHHKVMGKIGGIEVLDENDNVVKPLKDIFSLIAETDMILSLGHQSCKERFILIDEALKMGVKKIEVVHPNQLICKMTVDQMKICADKGAYIGYYCTNFRPMQWSWNEFKEVYNKIGPDHIIASSDTGGIFMSPSSTESMRLYITGMLVNEIPDKDVEKMVKINAKTLLY